jgi:hypothetical protein
MTIQQFAETTFRVIAEGSFENHIPTALFPERDHIIALEGIPADVDVEDAALTWAQDNAQGTEEYLVVFKIDPTHFKVVRHWGGSFEEGVFKIADA